MSSNRNTVSDLSKDELLDILNDIDAEREQDTTNIPDHQNGKGHQLKIGLGSNVAHFVSVPSETENK